MKSLIIPALVASIVSSTAIAQTEKPQVAYKLLPLSLADTKGHYFAEVEVNGKKANYLIDSGCSAYFVTSKKFAESANLPLKEAGQSKTVVGMSKRYSSEIAKMKLGKVKTLSKLKTAVTDFGSQSSIKVNGRKKSVDGLIGSPLLKALRVTLDFQKSQILFAPKNAPKNFYASVRQKAGDILVKLTEGPGGAPYIPVTMNGKKFIFLVDSGASGNLITNEAVKVLGMTPIKREGKSSGLIVKNPVMGRLQINELLFLVRDEVKLGKIEAEGYTFGGIIGSKVLRSLKASFDYDSYYLVFDKSLKN